MPLLVHCLVFPLPGAWLVSKGGEAVMSCFSPEEEKLKLRGAAVMHVPMPAAGWAREYSIQHAGMSTVHHAAVVIAELLRRACAARSPASVLTKSVVYCIGC